MSGRRAAILEAATRVIARDGVRGLRVEEIAAEAGVSTSLLYYHFKDRAGLLARTLDFVNSRSEHYTAPEVDADADPRGHLTEMLLLELQDTPLVVETSRVWGELRASAVFQPELREQLNATTARWAEYASELISRAQERGRVAAHVSPDDAADRLCALVEGLSERWLSGSLSLQRARDLLRGGIAAELGEP
ncbi:TetR/AcrR family transcriptional regulator [Streptomyces alkaliterrae]|uniref:TetR family transcriptional regulator n=1 Tax=Streptomyces alkaliterrae TaxID=2213162 RepID=A0A5P0YVH8_9ACTN|nr:TetR family transcriptional regulator [Streptomyces alkaliterrae]MBB1254520.1 TetR family transcriptional regulator C-terminal domain-containing protein [Streptomyces alkaliterrae]MBB1260453.1 TetR family transcriptional regulator C-terminal domain-containing protein [Streptomyces alkaliterrae]MQS03482.1 TetR family transcriptional regulator [Streptomyces alkaliterrae]